MPQVDEVSRLLIAWREGERTALDELFPIVYRELRQIAHRQLRNERRGHTLNTTALVHEAYLKLVKFDRIEWKNRAQFFAIAARAMRRILVDYALSRKRQKRGGGEALLNLEDVVVMIDDRADEMVALNQALERLEAIDPRHTRVIECRIFAGMSVEETADALDLSPATVKRDWAVARAWLNRELSA
jgi:RNA polymerase sigma-70 factor, ECF subfamily